MPRVRARRAGQPVGARSASGRRRDRTPERMPPCDGVLRRRAYYGGGADAAEGHDAIGRAWLAGMLDDDPARGRAMLDAGRRVAGRYRAQYRLGTPDSLARFLPSAGEPVDEALDAAKRAVLANRLAAVDACGRSVRLAFDALVIDPHADDGPPFLDRLIAARRAGSPARAGDAATLALACQGLAACVATPRARAIDRR